LVIAFSLGCIYGSVQSVGTRAVNFSDEPTENLAPGSPRNDDRNSVDL
jgi:hypothetical protein